MKKIIKLSLVIAFLGVAGYSIYSSHKPQALSNLMLANIEALASNSESGPSPCGGPKVNGECQSTNPYNCKDLSGCQ